ncbi:MAG: HTTM domain-containing protein [Planctomycetota bacterium]
MITLEQLANGWNTFFFRPQSTYPLELFRIGFGVLVAIYGLLIVRAVRSHLAPDAIFSLKRFEQAFGKKRFSLFSVLPASILMVYAVIVCCILAGICLAIGFCTRAASILAFLAIASLHHRNPGILNSGDTLMRLLSFLLMFSSAGKGWSLDAWMAGTWEAEAAPWSFRLMQIQVSMVYFHTFLWKMRGPKWRDGTAVWYAVQCDSFMRFPIPKFFMKPFFIRAATWSALMLELALSTLIWIEEFRFWLVCLGIAFHLSLEYVMNLQLFGWVMMTSLLLFL